MGYRRRFEADMGLSLSKGSIFPGDVKGLVPLEALGGFNDTHVNEFIFFFKRLTLCGRAVVIALIFSFFASSGCRFVAKRRDD